MKNQLKKLRVAALMGCIAAALPAQERYAAAKPAMDRIEPYKIEITYDKTSHLIFPAAIRYVDLGSEYLAAGKAEDASNVLRVKAAVRDFKAATNFSVITDDGRFYNFDASYSARPDALSYDLSVQRGPAGDVLLRELGADSPATAGRLLESICKKGKRNVRHGSAARHGIRFSLKGIYMHGGKYYFHTELRNRSNVPFETDFVAFTIADRKASRRTAVQQRPVLPLRTCKSLSGTGRAAAEQAAFLLDPFALSGGKVLQIAVFEKDGARHLTLQVTRSELAKASVLRGLRPEL